MQSDCVAELKQLLEGCNSVTEVNKAMHENARHWSRISIPEEHVNRLMGVVRHPDNQCVLQELAGKVSGSGIELFGDNVSEELQTHFRENIAGAPVPIIEYIEALNFAPVSWTMDPVREKPNIMFPSHLTSRFDFFYNHFAKVSLLMRWDTVLKAYDLFTEFLVVQYPQPDGSIVSVAQLLLEDYDMLRDLRTRTHAAINARPQFVLQKRPEEKQDHLLDVISGLEQEVHLVPPKRDQPLTHRASACADMIVVDEGFEILRADHLRVPSRVELPSYDEARRRFRARVYNLLGLPADGAEERRREFGNARSAADHDLNRAILVWTERVMQALSLGVRMAYPIMFVQDEAAQLALHRDRHVQHLQRAIDYLHGTDSDIPEQFEDLLERVRPPSPSLADIHRAVATVLPTVRMHPDRRFTADELQLMRQNSLLDPDVARRVEADTLGVSNLVAAKRPAAACEDQPEPKRPRPLEQKPEDVDE